MKTCGNCPFVRVNKTRLMAIAFCGKTEDGLIVPHEWRGGDALFFSRVPEFCTNENATPSSKPAPLEDWVRRTVDELTEKDTGESK
ncbi:hypothetical protein ABXV22_01725 [Vibrio rotiferianus]|uniref:hypothetical protein n=1 Tax=Vibrio harveyi group TaxID=717610 RepID=UPI0007AF9DBC|nr:hypothetical protein [Vibrio jasicida]